MPGQAWRCSAHPIEASPSHAVGPTRTRPLALALGGGWCVPGFGCTSSRRITRHRGASAPRSQLHALCSRSADALAAARRR